MRVMSVRFRQDCAQLRLARANFPMFLHSFSYSRSRWLAFAHLALATGFIYNCKESLKSSSCRLYLADLRGSCRIFQSMPYEREREREREMG